MTDKKIDFDAYEIPEPPASMVDDIVARAAGSRSASPVRRSAWPLVAAGVVAVASAALVLFMVTRDDDGAAGQRAVASDQRDASGEQAPDPREDPVERAGDRKLVRVLPSKAAREDLLVAIETARLQRLRAVSPAPANPGSPAAGAGQTGTLDRRTIQKAMSEIRPLFIECYEMALEHDADFGGKVIAEFRIVGEPDVGGLVAEVELESDDGMVDPGEDDEVTASGVFAECMRETIMSLEVPAPNGGGEVTVRYPFIFRSDEQRGAPGNQPTHGLPSKKQTLLVEARAAAKTGEWGKALMKCQMALHSAPEDAEALMVCALSACNLRQKDLSQEYFDRLSSPTRKAMARQICLKNGVKLD